MLSWIALVFFLVEGARRRRDWLPLLAWFLVTYGVFSIATTKMKSYVFIASPVPWCALVWFCVEAGRTIAVLRQPDAPEPERVKEFSPDAWLLDAESLANP